MKQQQQQCVIADSSRSYLSDLYAYLYIYICIYIMIMRKEYKLYKKQKGKKQLYVHVTKNKKTKKKMICIIWYYFYGATTTYYYLLPLPGPICHVSFNNEKTKKSKNAPFMIFKFMKKKQQQINTTNSKLLYFLS